MTIADPRCPSCGAVVRAGSSWCTLCHADLRSDEERAAARPQVVVQDTPADAGGRHARRRSVAVAVGVRRELDEDEAVDPAPPVSSLADVDVAAMLEQLAAQSSDPRLGELESRLSSKSAKAVVISVGLLVVTVVAFGAMTVLGWLLS